MEFETIILIPNFNGIDHLKECLESVEGQSYKNFKTIVLDDKSTDNSIKFINKNFKNVELLINPENFGFAKSVNSGIIYSIKKYKPKYIALLNNDTEADKNWLKALIEAIELEDKIASVASNMFYYNNPDIINSQGGKCNFICIGYDINYGVDKNDVKNAQKKIISPCFGACLINVKYLNKIGLCDQRYSAYCEDLDWGMRANILGYKIIFEEKAIVYHKGSSTYGKDAFKKVYLCKRNSLCVLIKNYEIKNLLSALILTFLYYPIFSIGQFTNRKIKNRKLVRIEKNISIIERFELSLAPYFGIIWNIFNLKESLRLRKKIQAERKIRDEEIFEFQ